MMRLGLLCGLLLLAGPAAAQPALTVLPDSAYFLVAYVEVAPGGRAAAASALTAYRAGAARADGAIRIDLFEETRRPGHFVLIDVWRDQNAFFSSARDARAKLLDGLRPVRVSGWDERPYKALTLGTIAAGRPSSVIVVGHVDVSPDPKVPALLRRLAEASRSEPGNLRFDVLQHTMRPNHFTVVEAWRDDKAFAAHVLAEHTRAYREDVQPMTGSPLDNRILRAVE